MVWLYSLVSSGPCNFDFPMTCFLLLIIVFRLHEWLESKVLFWSPIAFSKDYNKSDDADPGRYSLETLRLNNLFHSKKWSLGKSLAVTRSALCHVHVTARMIMCLYGSKWWGISSVWQLSRAVSVGDRCWHSVWIVHQTNFRGGFYACLLAIGEYCKVV